MDMRDTEEIESAGLEYRFQKERKNSVSGVAAWVMGEMVTIQ